VALSAILVTSHLNLFIFAYMLLPGPVHCDLAPTDEDNRGALHDRRPKGSLNTSVQGSRVRIRMRGAVRSGGSPPSLSL